ncbi:MAG: inositol-3-phosphate synthase [Frankiaceae bacterium]|nr:inositol-3-phosphate synthase [Frankiaceae bacterium]MBV9869591.1 inositol-3-phosphate synthase [Frankiaceae bacterium]
MEPVNVALVGIGNCACSLVEGVSLQQLNTGSTEMTGVRLPTIGDYGVENLNFVAAFDITTPKVGADLSQAIRARPNETIAIAPVPALDVTVLRGPTMDGISGASASALEESPQPPIDVVEALIQAQAEVVVSYLPVGSDEATEFYADAAVKAGCALVNCMPTPVATSEIWTERFLRAGLPLVGDDVKSQMGATVLHRALLRLFRDRGIRLTNSYQLNVGGNGDFLNMSEPARGLAKERSKVRAIESIVPVDSELAPMAASVGYVPGLGDRKSAYIRFEGLTFGSAPVSLDIKLDVWDSPNSAGVVIDAIRYSKVAMDEGRGGPLKAACAYLMKSPPEQMEEEEALNELAKISPRRSR